MIIFGPIIITVILALFIAKTTGEVFECCFFKPGSGNSSLLYFWLVVFPINLIFALLHLALGLFLGGTFTAITYPIFVVGSVIKFAKIMRYWSNGNRFSGEGKVKAELFMRRSSSQSYGRRPTFHLPN